jgi:hypothetical protein
VRSRARKAVVRGTNAATPRKEPSRRAGAKSKPATAHAAAKPAWKRPPQSAVVAHSGGVKPSPAISKQNVGSN